MKTKRRNLAMIIIIIIIIIISHFWQLKHMENYFFFNFLIL